MKIKYSYNDVSIVPAVVSEVDSRSECCVFYPDGYLPIFTAPMSTIVNGENYYKYEDNNIHVIIPRNVPFITRLEFLQNHYWCAFSLKEAESFIYNSIDPYSKILIDIANGHMELLYSICNKIKAQYPDCQLMIGNIANPETYKYLTKYVKVDYVRVGIGSGFGCITSSNTGIHYPMASLLEEINKYKEYSTIKVIADGGIRNYSDVIKALALGADYVMIGGLFASLEESCGEVIEKDGCKYKRFYGMASAAGQTDIFGRKIKTSEGVEKLVKVTGTLPQWTDNMKSYLVSAMSYTNRFNLKNFVGNVQCVLMSNNTVNSINK